ncbi:hypothetical protein [Vulgatibacter sp.]|uniref:hypothetical protein n=1 Tax=Vulgatibacter sp. TaxID=1971226 RepID=UPI003561C6A4
MRSFTRAALVAALVLTPTAALAQLQVGFDVDAIFPDDEPLDEETGYGFAGRVGLVVPGTPVLDLVPEIQVGYLDFGTPGIDGSSFDLTMVRATAGLRAGIGTVLRPTAFGHVGWGQTSLSANGDDIDFFEDRSGIGEESGFTWDLGLALDLAILPLVTVGVHGAYNGLDLDEESLNWWTAGAHAAVTF